MGAGSDPFYNAPVVLESEEGKEILKSIGIEGEWEGIGNLKTEDVYLILVIEVNIC